MIKHESAPGSPSATAQAHVPGDGASEVDEGRPSKPRLPLRPRIILVVVSVLFSIVMLLSLYFTARERSMVEQATQEKVDVMREDMRSKGIVLARSVALSSATAIAFKNYSFLRDVIRSIVQNDTNVSYGIIMSQTGMALIHTDVSKAGAVLDGPSDRQAIEAEDVAAFDVTQEGRDYLEVLAPIEVGGKVWGKVRFGLSLEPLNAAIRSSAESSRAAIDRAIARGLIAALLLISAGSWVGMRISRRLTDPLDALLEAVRFVQQGDLDRRVPNNSDIPEFATLAGAFNDMSAAVKKRQADVEDALRKMEEAYRLKSQFLANVSHELRTPLNALINVPPILLKDYVLTKTYRCDGCGQAYEVEEEEGDEALPAMLECPQCHAQAQLAITRAFKGNPSEHQTYIEMGFKSAKHLLNVVNDLLDVSKLEAGRMELFISQFGLADLLGEVSQTVALLAAEKGQVLKLPNLEGPNLDMRADYVKLSQMLINLLGNAIKFTPPGGVIECAVDGLEDASPEARLRFRIKDSGEGIPRGMLETIFEGFRQVDGGHTRKHGGTGLGLTITRQLAQLHGGSVSVESEVGQGSTFIIELPRYTKPKEVPAENVSTPQRGTVVVVDDDPIQLSLVFKVLSDAGYRVVTVKSPREGLEVIEQVLPDAAIFDVMMPDISGLSLLRRLRGDARFAKLPILICTAFGDQSEMVRVQGAHWLPKPWLASDLLATLNKSITEVAVAGKVIPAENQAAPGAMEPVPAEAATQSKAQEGSLS